LSAICAIRRCSRASISPICSRSSAAASTSATRLVGSLCRESGERDLEQHPRLEQLVELDALRLEHARDGRAHAQADPLLGCRRHEDPPAGTLGGADQVLAGEQPQRLAQRRAADAEVPREILLASEPVSRPEPVGQHEQADPLSHDLGDAVPALGLSGVLTQR
jgi:hypothetical protein